MTADESFGSSALRVSKEACRLRSQGLWSTMMVSPCPNLYHARTRLEPISLRGYNPIQSYCRSLYQYRDKA
jgi:hypothetical protein